MLELNDPTLLRTQCLIDGAWVGADDGRTLAVTNPASGATVAAVPHAGAAETRRAIAAAERAMVGWKALFGWEHAVLWIEGTLIVLFAAFWVSQTQELWNDGIRQELPRSQATPSPLRSSSVE